MPTFKEIEAAVAEACGRAVVEQMASPDPHANALPIRQHRTGQIVAYVPEGHCRGLAPVVFNALVVGYYRETDKGRQHPRFCDKRFIGWAPSKPGELWMAVFDEDGRALGSRLLGVEDEP